MIQEIENSRIPKGRIDLIGFGRLGLRVGIHLIQVHRGGPKEIGVFDGQKIDGGDIIFTMKGAKVGEYKSDFLNKLCTHDESFRKIISVCEDITPDNLDLIKGDVVAIQIAGGKTISTAGIFGFGDETVEVRDISEFEDNPAVDELRKEGITENHLIVTTNKLLRDKEPITPYTLDEVAKQITKTSLKLLKDSYD